MKIAIVTGASSGIGREFCRQLDSEGFEEIWGIALPDSNLESLKNELKTPVKTIGLDLTNPSDLEKYEQTLKQSNAEVSWLVNCSGYCKFGDYKAIPLKTSLNMIDLNVKALVATTELTLPFIKKGGKIIEIASMAGMQPVPYMNVYSASKAFVLSYSRALNKEVKKAEISITCVCPLWTKTNFLNVARQTTNNVVTYISTQYDPKKVVRRAIKDTKKKRDVSIFGFKAKNQRLLVKLFPHSMAMDIWLRQQKLK